MRIRKHLSLWAAALALTVGGVIFAPTANAAASADPCVIKIDSRLWCNNNSQALIRASAHHSAEITGQLLTGYSWFDCWASGDLHGGGNTTWYHTKGDWTRPGYDGWGYVPANMLYTSSEFDADPTAYGLRHC
jgi:phosphate-selective porin